MPLQPQLLRGLRQIEPPNLLGRAQQVNALRNQQLSIQQNELALNQQNQKAQQAQAVHDIIVKHGGDFEKALPEIRSVAPELSVQFENLVSERQDRTEAQTDKRIAREVLGRNAAAQEFTALEGTPAETVGVPGAMTQPESPIPEGGTVAPIKSPIPASFEASRSVPFPAMPTLGRPGFSKKVTSAKEQLQQQNAARRQELALTREANTYTVQDPSSGKTVTGPKDLLDNLLTQTGQTARQGEQQAFTAEQNRLQRESQQAMNDARIAAAAERALAAGKSSKTVSQAMTLSNRYDSNPIVKRFVTVKQGLDFMNELGPTSADDMGVLYAFAKAMDPESVVREGEYATVQKYAQSWAEKFGFQAARMVDNTRFLTAEARKNMISTVKAKAKTEESAYRNFRDETTKKFKDIGEDPSTWLVDYGTTAEKAPVIVQQSPSTGAYRHSTDGGKTWLNGKPQ